MRIATFNIRCDVAADGINSFTNRRGFVMDRIEAHDADIIGFQEVRPEMNEYLRTHMRGYTLVGCGRGANYDGEHNPVAFKSEQYELIALDVTWLSPTPFVPGSRYAVQSSCPRIITHTILRPLDKNGQPFHFYNTHLDHVSSEARVQGAQRLLDKIAQDQTTHPFPLILTGDFNAYPDSNEMRLLSDNLVDQTPNLGTTWHNYGKSHDEQIDYIFTKDFDIVGKPVMWTEQLDGLYLSDHYPVEVELKRQDGGAL